jgi:hypothetical protein
MKKSSSEDPTDEQILKFLFTRADCEPLGPAHYEVELQLVPIVCGKYHQGLAAVCGYRYEEVFITLADLSDARTVTAFVAELRQQTPGISPVSHRSSTTAGGQYVAVEWPWCGARFGSFFITNALFPDRLPLNFQYPSCYYQFPHIECDSFKYHSLTLNIGPEEAQHISDYRGLTK